MVHLTRRVTFCAGHVYRGAGLSDSELQRAFGIAAEPSGHGHNYVLEVTIAGPVDPVNGMVVNIKDLDAVLKDLLHPLDHRMLNTALPEFKDGVPTTEKLAQVIWARLPKTCGSGHATSLRLEEHPGLHVEIFAENPNMVYLTRSIEFAASHRLHTDQLDHTENVRIYGKCNNPHGHGHNYVAEITVKGEPDPRLGIVADIGAVDELLKKEIESRFDHKHLNLDTDYFKNKVATAENIAIVIWDLLKPKISICRSGGKVELHKVRLIETARSWFDYYGS